MKLDLVFWLRVHRQVGVAAALFLLLIAVSGLLLNHSRELGLHEVYLDAPWILSAYNMELPDDYIVNVETIDDVTYVTTQEEVLTLDPGQDVVQTVSENYRGKGVSLEKFLLDMHTGQIIGITGSLLLDLVAIAMIFLTCTGLYNTWERSR